MGERLMSRESGKLLQQRVVHTRAMTCTKHFTRGEACRRLKSVAQVSVDDTELSVKMDLHLHATV